MNLREGARALVICGPTASGKSSIALAVAEQLGGEIINADSRQIYRGMRVGTGMPTRDAFQKVPHHLYAFVDPAQRYSAARFSGAATQLTKEICSRGQLPIVVGGTGFYIEALTGTMALDRPPPDDALRARLRRESRVHAPEVLWEWLRVRAPAIAAEVRPGDSYRILRGLERAMSEQPPADAAHRSRDDMRFVIICLRVPRAELRRRIASRARAMFDAGLMQEAWAVRTTAADAPALSGLGYAEALALWDGSATRSEAIARTIARTEQYAKRQETWFRHMREAIVIDAAVEEVAIANLTALARERLVDA